MFFPCQAPNNDSDQIDRPESASQVTDAEFDLNQWSTVQFVIALSLDECETGYVGPPSPRVRARRPWRRRARWRPAREAQAIDDARARTSGLARALGISGIPAFVIGDQLIRGAVDLARLKAVVRGAREGP